MNNGIFTQYLSDYTVEEIVSDESFIKKMLTVEIALAKVQAKQQIIPAEAAKEIATKLEDFAPSPEDLAEGTIQHGIPTITMIALAKQELSETSGDYLHWGATSQDIMDTATILMIKDFLTVIEKRVLRIIGLLEKLVSKHEHTLMVARTRTQQAVPISFGLKVHNWLQPLERHLERLQEMKSRLLVVQFGGAGGNVAALGSEGLSTAQLLAKELKLGFAGIWQSQRDNLGEFASWLALLSGSFGKMASDILLLCQTEVGEIEENTNGGGKSSTMPHKKNPVLSEAIVALSQHVFQLSGNHFMLHKHERDGASWILEWLTLPKMMRAIGAMTNHGLVVSTNLKVNKEIMLENLEKLNGLVYSEQASFILAQHMSRSEAKTQVGIACKMVLGKGIHLAEALKKTVPAIKIDWASTLQAKNYQGSTSYIIKKK